MLMRTRKQKGLTISYFALVLVVLKSHHGSERVNYCRPVNTYQLIKPGTHDLTGRSVCLCYSGGGMDMKPMGGAVYIFIEKVRLELSAITSLSPSLSLCLFFFFFFLVELGRILV